MRFKILSLCMVFSLAAFSQQNLKEITADQIPASMKIKGDFVSGVSYSDSLGLNYVIQTETKLFTPKSAIEAAKHYELINVDGRVDTIRNVEADYRIKGLFVYHYVQTKDSANLIWKHLDNVNNCTEKTLEAAYLTKPIVTDINADGKCEVFLVYQLGCRETKDVGLVLKMVMYKDTKQYMVRDVRQTKTSKVPEKPTVKADDSIKELSPAEREYAFKLWSSYIMEE